MPFSQQTYTGQGIVQPTERSRVGEFLGAGLAGLGAGIGEGIKKFRQDKEEAKELRANLKLFRKTIPEEEREAFDATIEAGSLADLRGLKRGILEMGAFELQELQKQEAEEALAAKKFARQKSQQEGQFYADYFGMREPQQVQRDFGPDISAAEQRLIEAQQAGFRPEFTFPKSSEVPASREEPAPADLSKFYGRLGLIDKAGTFVESLFGGKKPSRFGGIGGALGAGYGMPKPSQASKPAGGFVSDIPGREEMQAMRRAGVLDKTFAPPPPVTERPAAPQPAAPSQPMGPEPALEPSPEVQQAARDLEAIRIQAAEGDTRLETSQEVMRRVSESIPELVEKYPTQAKNLYEMLYPKQDKLTPSEQIAMMKLQREVQASEVAGYGVAPSVQIAQDFREFAIPTGEGIEKIQELIDIAKQGLVGKLSPENRNRATSIQKRLMGELKEQIVGAGAVSEGEWQILASVIPDVTKIMSFSDVNIKVLKELQDDLKAKLKNRANAISWSPLQGGMGAMSRQPTGGTVSYGMSGKPEMK